MSEPIVWIQPNHLQQARKAPFLCRVEPTQGQPDFVPLYTHPPAALAARDARFAAAMKQTWQMVDPLHPPGQPGSYARGEYYGVVGALTTIRANYDRIAAIDSEREKG